MTTTLESLRSRAIAAHEEHDANVSEELQRQHVARIARYRDDLSRLLARTLGVTDGVSIAEYSWSPDGADYQMVETRATVDGLTFAERGGSSRGHSTSLCLLVRCERGCGKDLWKEVESIEDLGSVLSAKHEHAFECLIRFDDDGEPITDTMGNPLPPREPVAPRLSPEQQARQSIDALPLAAQRCADALNTIAELEDERALIKPQAIRRILDAGAASSATAAEKIVEADPDYAAHRRKQRDAEIEKWAAAASYESAKLTAALDVALCRAMERAD